jgi:hypothetical protein
MTKGSALILTTLILLTSCSKSTPIVDQGSGTPVVESFPIANTKFQNCRFQTAAPTYGVNSTITPNPIVCDAGVAKAVQLISTTPLPQGIIFSSDTLSLVGTPTVAMASTIFDFYIENESGYVILPLTITVK